jgi:hypothetical protein
MGCKHNSTRWTHHCLGCSYRTHSPPFSTKYRRLPKEKEYNRKHFLILQYVIHEAHVERYNDMWVAKVLTRAVPHYCLPTNPQEEDELRGDRLFPPRRVRPPPRHGIKCVGIKSPFSGEVRSGWTASRTSFIPSPNSCLP